MTSGRLARLQVAVELLSTVWPGRSHRNGQHTPTRAFSPLGDAVGLVSSLRVGRWRAWRSGAPGAAHARRGRRATGQHARRRMVDTRGELTAQEAVIARWPATACPTGDRQPAVHQCPDRAVGGDPVGSGVAELWWSWPGVA